jgi:hypothetical protein
MHFADTSHVYLAYYMYVCFVFEWRTQKKTASTRATCTGMTGCFMRFYEVLAQKGDEMGSFRNYLFGGEVAIPDLPAKNRK